MSSKQPSMLTGQVIRDGLSYILRCGLCIKNGHLPSAGHTIPTNFIGVCVASNANPETDNYLVEQLHALGINRVRLDFTYGDLENHNTRFLNRLIAESFEITLHIVQPFEAAKNMQSESGQAIWRQFLQEILNRFSKQIIQIEVGNTINRKRWAGYTFDGFLITWQIAHGLIKAQNLTLVGPNIQDFEPVYNISLLKAFKEKNLLPDIHSDNLFTERVSEPEQFDHRVFKYQWATIFKFNLIKKARVLKKIGTDFSVPHLMSPAAFWSMFRLKRRFAQPAQKQADYAARYFLLLASSGALKQVNWGTFVCQREGLIEDGLQEADYPKLERVTHYKSADGELKNYVRRPSFDAVKTVTSILHGAKYLGAIANGRGLEIHHFQQGKQHIHAAWTINGKVAFLNEIYSEHALEAAQILARGGTVLDDCEIISESPIYIIWKNSADIQHSVNPQLARDLTIYAHVENKRYFKFEDNNWRGLLLAKDRQEATLLAQALHPEKLIKPNKDGALRHARNAIWAIDDPRDNAKQITIKQPVKMYPHKAFLDRFKPSKARRSWNGAMELLRRGIDSAAPVAYFEKKGDDTLTQNFYLCDFVKADCTIGQMFSAFAQGESSYLGMQAEEVYFQFAQFCSQLHGRLVYFRDFSGGNILVKINEQKKLTFSLIDTARLKGFHITPFPMRYRLADLARACHKLHWAGRERFMQIYLGLMGWRFAWRQRQAFYLYDFKVGLKRTIGRKGIKRLLKKLKRTQSI